MGGPSPGLELWRSLSPRSQSQTQSPQPCLWGSGSLVFSEEGLSGEGASWPLSCHSQNQAGP